MGSKCQRKSSIDQISVTLVPVYFMHKHALTSTGSQSDLNIEAKMTTHSEGHHYATIFKEEKKIATILMFVNDAINMIIYRI